MYLFENLFRDGRWEMATGSVDRRENDVSF